MSTRTMPSAVILAGTGPRNNAINATPWTNNKYYYRVC